MASPGYDLMVWMDPPDETDNAPTSVPQIGRLSRLPHTRTQVAHSDKATQNRVADARGSLDVLGAARVAKHVCEHQDTMLVLGVWLTWLKASYAPTSVRGYWGYAMRFLTACPKPLEDVTEMDVADWIESFPYRSASRRGAYQALKVLFEWCLPRGYVEANPVTVKVPAVIEKVPRALSEAEYEKVLGAAYERDPRRGLTIALLYHTAARIDEVRHLRWEDVTDEAVVLRKTKNGNEREIPMTPALREVLAGLFGFFGAREFVIPRSAQTVGKWCKEAGDAVGIEHVHPHLLRSTAATRMLVRGARPHAVREVLGHRSLKTTQAYWAVEAVDKAEAVALL